MTRRPRFPDAPVTAMDMVVPFQAGGSVGENERVVGQISGDAVARAAHQESADQGDGEERARGDGEGDVVAVHGSGVFAAPGGGVVGEERGDGTAVDAAEQSGADGAADLLGAPRADQGMARGLHGRDRSGDT
jgi:hypothetical protein